MACEIARWLCTNLYDLSAFGAVTATEVNAGKVRPPAQPKFLESIDARWPQEVAIAGSSVANGRDAESERTMGRESSVPDGPCRCHGHVSASRAGDETGGSGFRQENLAFQFAPPGQTFQYDRSAAGIEMNPKDLIVFRHAGALGDALAQKSFRRVRVDCKPQVKAPRGVVDHAATADDAELARGEALLGPST